MAAAADKPVVPLSGGAAADGGMLRDLLHHNSIMVRNVSLTVARELPVQSAPSTTASKTKVYSVSVLLVAEDKELWRGVAKTYRGQDLNDPDLSRLDSIIKTHAPATVLILREPMAQVTLQGRHWDEFSTKERNEDVSWYVGQAYQVQMPPHYAIPFDDSEALDDVTFPDELKLSNNVVTLAWLEAILIVLPPKAPPCKTRAGTLPAYVRPAVFGRFRNDAVGSFTRVRTAHPLALALDGA